MRRGRTTERTVRGRFLASIAGAGVLLGAVFTTARADIAIVVPAASSLDSLSVVQLRGLYRGEIGTLEGNRRVVLGTTPDLEEAFCQQVLGMSALRMRKHWMKLVFSTSGLTPPTVLRDRDAVAAFLGREPAGVCFLDAAEAARLPGARVLAVDGKRPGAPGYPLLGPAR